MWIYGGTLDLVGCTFLENSASYSGGDLYNRGTVNIDGCASGYWGVGTDLDTSNDGGTITGEAKSYSCGACVR